MLNRFFSGIAGLSAFTATGALIAALQATATEKPGDTTWLWTTAAASAAIFVVGAIGWLLTSSDSPKGAATLSVQSRASHNSEALAAGRDVVKISTVNLSSQPSTTHDAQHEVEAAIAQLKTGSYKIAGASRTGVDVLHRMANDLLIPRDSFTFRAFIAANFGTGSDSIDERPIIAAFLSAGVIERDDKSFVLSSLGGRVHDRSRYEAALAAIVQHIRAGNSLLDECGRPREDYHLAPMHFIDVCVPKINEWMGVASNDIRLLVPEFQDKLENIGNVTHDTEKKLQ